MTDDEVQAAIEAFAARVGVTRAGGWSHVPDRVNRDKWEPLLEARGQRVRLRGPWPGQQSTRHESRSVDDLLFWVTSDIARWVELTAGLRPDWGDCVAAYVNHVLRSAP